MICRIQEFRYKDVVCVEVGTRLGYVGDVEIDTQNAQLRSIVVHGRYRWLFFGREEDIKICWNEIEVIGDDTVLVCGDSVGERGQRVKRGIFEGFFRT